MTLVAHDDGGNVGKSEPFAFRLPRARFHQAAGAGAGRAAPQSGARCQCAAARAHRARCAGAGAGKIHADAGVYLGLRTIFWSLVRAKTDDDLRDVVARLWSMAVGIEDGDMSDAQAALRNAEKALQQALERGASDHEIKQLMDQLRAAMDRFMQALAEQLKNNQQLARPLDPNAKVLSQRDLQNMLDRLENMARNGAKDAARQLLQQLEQMMENLQMASPDMNDGDDDDMMSELDELGDMIRQQQDLRDRTFQQGQDQRQQRRAAAERQAGPAGSRSRASRWASCSRTSRRCATGSTNCSTS